MYHSKPPERGAEGLKAPNMTVDRCCYVILLPLMGGFEVSLAVKSRLPAALGWLRGGDGEHT